MTAGTLAAPVAPPSRSLMQRAATRRLMHVAPDHADRLRDPIGYWDAYTSGCDARTALSLAIGVPVHLVDPSTGTFTTGCQP